MTPAAADWVYDVVLTRRYKEATGAIMWTGKGAARHDEGKGAAFLRMCPCQYGRCGWCGEGKHERCPHHVHRPRATGAARVLAVRGVVLAEVWPTGRPCRWRCPCGCPAPEPEPTSEPAPAPAFEQLDLFALAGGAR